MPLHISREKPGVRWSGAFFAHHSLAYVNREMSLALMDDPAFAGQFDLCLDERGSRGFAVDGDPRLQRLADAIGHDPSEVKAVVRHQWPPDFQSPASGRFVLCQPWEFGSLPREWVTQIDRCVDEVWAYTEAVRQTYIDSGVPARKVRVVPLGIDPARFHPGVEPFDFDAHPQTRGVRPGDYKFLFVGGTIPRKGIDVLLDAFDRSFRAGDPVTLIIKDFGTNSFYANQGAGMLIRALQVKPGGSRIVYLTDDLSETEMAALYAACDCLVHPYRGEGYGLPIAEAMACGKPTIVTGGGAAMDFANAENAYLIPATRAYLNQKEIGGLETVSRPFWLEPDTRALQDILRRVVDNPAEAFAIGAQAARDIAARHTWAHAAGHAAARLSELASEANTAAITSFSLPMGLANFGLSALNGLEMPGDTEKARYEDLKQGGLAATRAGDWMKAVRDLEECLLDRPEDWDVLNALGVAKFRTGDRAAALTILRHGAAESPSPRDFHHNLAYLLLADEIAEEAGEALDHAMLAYRCSPEDLNIRRTLERARESALKSARKLLRGASNGNRAGAKRDSRYVRLMDSYRSAELILAGAGGQAISAVVVSDSPAVKPHARISLVMIVKNEERFLRNCLASARGLVDEIVIVDTGSSDNTPQIAREFGAKLVHHAWTDDFSAARNISLEHATGDWALWLDADEEIAPESGGSFRAAVESATPDIGGFMIEFRNWLQSTTRREDTDMAVHHACRLFRLVPGVRFEGRIHEQNLRSLQQLGYRYAYVPGLTLDHFGYSGEIMTARNKHERFIRMLTREVEECPDPSLSHFHLFNLGNAYFTFGDMENAAIYLRRAADRPDVKEEFTGTLFTELATALQHLGRLEEGLTVCVEADRLGLRDSGVDFARGHCLLHLLRYSEAEKSFRAAIHIGESESALARTGDRGTAGYKARYGLALALVGQDRFDEARIECEAALKAQPGFADARYLLSVALRKLSRSRDAVDVLDGLLRMAPDHHDARRDLAKLLFDAGDFRSATPHVESLVSVESDSCALQEMLAACYSSAGRPDAACAVYERMRELQPESAKIRVNLGRALASRGANTEALACYVEAIRIDPAYGNAYFNAGDLLYQLGQYSDAAQSYMAGLEVCPDQPSGLFVLGNCLVQTSQYEAAELCFRQELVRDPQHGEARHNLALVEDIVTRNQVGKL